MCDEFAAEFAKIDGLDFAGVRRTESDALFPRALIHKDSHEERFAGEQAFTGPEERTHETFARRRAVAKNRLHRNAFIHEHHAAGFGDDGFLGIELDFDKLHVVAVNGVINDVHGGKEGRLAGGVHGKREGKLGEGRNACEDKESWEAGRSKSIRR